MHSFQMGQVLGFGGVEIIHETDLGERRRSKKQSNNLEIFSSLPAPKFAKQGTKNEDKTKLEPRNLGAPEKDPADLFSARKFP